MLQYSKLVLVLVFSVVLQGCYTSANMSTINIEIIIPGNQKLSHEYKNLAVRYNNSNISRNPRFSDYNEDNEKFTDTTNIDSIASEIYFQNFINVFPLIHKGRLLCLPFFFHLNSFPDSYSPVMITNHVSESKKIMPVSN